MLTESGNAAEVNASEAVSSMGNIDGNAAGERGQDGLSSSASGSVGASQDMHSSETATNDSKVVLHPALHGAQTPHIDPAHISTSVDREALVSLVRTMKESAEANRKWYDERAGSIGKKSRRLRFWAVVLGVLGGLCPLLPSSLSGTLFGAAVAANVSAAGFVFLALAAGALLLDQVFGYSSSWMRYRLAELKLAKLIRAFNVDVETELAKSSGQSIPADRAETIIAHLRAFVSTVHDVVIGETETWIAEFKAGLLQVEQITRAGSKSTGGQK